ncbi:hypothetical protein F6J84_11860 [Microbacterium caowuchunii]|uniref:hypothetical protein n=1 Tax=Microbacterium caowuchunii TaxID=2614638 RepID=UPI001243DFEE|nr:hypothetical protein [Microbacterium caowuchunii]QEW00725.1 hypothetical protein F6J84_11860 [Microbacterium caowuchunii]
MSGSAYGQLVELIEQTRQRVEAIEQIALGARRIGETDEDEDAAEAFARRARSGALGREWSVLQGRIDLGETTLAAIMSGDDPSPEAQAVREASRARLAALTDAERERAEQAGEPDPAAELARDRERLLARGAALRARISDELGRRPSGGAE